MSTSGKKAKKFSGRAIKDLMRGVAVKEGCKPARIDRNTIRYVNRDGVTVYRLHDTNIVFVDGKRVTINTGGWLTVTTLSRVRAILRALGLGDNISGVYGSRAWAYEGIAFRSTLDIINGVPRGNKTTCREAEAARLDYQAARAFSRKEYAVRRKQRDALKRRQKFGPEFYDLYASEKARMQEESAS